VNEVVVSLCVIVGLLSLAITWAMSRYGAQLGFVDQPNARSLHQAITPRAGGLGFALLAPAATLLVFSRWVAPVPRAYVVLLTTATALALFSLADDRWGLSVGVRLLAHFGAALALVLAGGVLHEIVLPGGFVVPLGPAASAATILWVMAFTNIYNFMDGSDGLAAGQAIVAASAMALFAANANVPAVTLAMALLAATVAGFLVLNWPPARIFMGDVGSTFLGFTFAGWAVLTGGTRDAPLPFVAWLTVLSPFLFDAALTLVRRTLRGERIHQPHREHMYQQLIRRGWSHAAVALLYIGLASAAAALTLGYYVSGHLTAALFVVLLGVILAIPIVLTPPWRRD
jgi:UDP-N-acetylmuramyl pentapeptide phosphotransferase/UDP-N-acetylglucosamine-1-phosphate transferase